MTIGVALFVVVVLALAIGVVLRMVMEPECPHCRTRAPRSATICPACREPR